MSGRKCKVPELRKQKIVFEFPQWFFKAAILVDEALMD
jgi:hypothetical protein